MLIPKSVRPIEYIDEIPDAIVEIIQSCTDAKIIAKLHEVLLGLAPKAEITPVDSWDWLKRFVSRDDTREWTHYLYSDGQTLSATNGNILAWCKTDKAQGFYEPDGRSAEWFDNRPNTNRAIPDDKAPQLDIDDLIDGIAYRSGYWAYKIGPAYFRKEHVDRICSAGGVIKIVTPKNAEEPVRGTTRLGEFVISPMMW